jgi:hypothetical protein
MFISLIDSSLMLDPKEDDCVAGLVCWLGNGSFRVDAFASIEAAKIAPAQTKTGQVGEILKRFHVWRGLVRF